MPAVLVLTLGTLGAFASSAAAAPPPTIRLLPPLTSPVTSYAFRGRVPLDFGVLVSAVNGNVELRVSRANYESPLTAWQSDSETGALLQTLPPENLKGWNGLRRFFRYTITTRTGAPVKTLYRPFASGSMPPVLSKSSLRRR